MNLNKHVIIAICSLALAGCNEPELQNTTPQTKTLIAPDQSRKSIRMSGYGKVFYDADICDISFMVVTTASEDLTKAFDEHRSKTSEINSFMSTYADSKTICAETGTFLNKEENKPYVYQTDYSARVPIQEDVAILQRELISRGVNRIISMELRSSQYNELLKKCRDLAISDARSKVEYIANVTNREISDLIEVDLTTENLSTWRYGHPPQLRQYGGRGRSVTNPESSFETYVDVTVQVTFLLKNKLKTEKAVSVGSR